MKYYCSRNQWRRYPFIRIVLNTLLSDMTIVCVIWCILVFSSGLRVFAVLNMTCPLALLNEQKNSLPLGDVEADVMKDINYVNILCKEPPTSNFN